MFPLKMGGDRWVRVRTHWVGGGRSKRTCAYDGGGGQILTTLLCMR